MPKKGLDELGPMTIREKTLLGLFVLAVLSWALGERIGIEEASTTAISVMTLLVVCGVVAWEDLLKNKGAWNTHHTGTAACVGYLLPRHLVR